MPLRNAQATTRGVAPAYRDREELGELQADASCPASTRDRLELISPAGEQLSAELSGIADPTQRNEEEKGISLRELSVALKAASDDADRNTFTGGSAHRWFEGSCSAPSAMRLPSSFHTAYMPPSLATRVHVHEGSRHRRSRWRR